MVVGAWLIIFLRRPPSERTWPDRVGWRALGPFVLGSYTTKALDFAGRESAEMFGASVNLSALGWVVERRLVESPAGQPQDLVGLAKLLDLAFEIFEALRFGPAHGRAPSQHPSLAA